MANEKSEVKDPSEEEGVKVVDDLKMSRTEEPEYSVNFEKLRDKVVYDGLGNKIKFGDIYKMQKTIVVFVRVNLFIFFFKTLFHKNIGAKSMEYLQFSSPRKYKLDACVSKIQT